LGGIAGVRLRTELDTSDLPPAHGARVEDAVRSLSGSSSSTPPHPDAFRYEITQLEDPDSAPVSIDERDLPPDLKGLVEQATKTAEIEGPDR
jgi:Emfourin